MLKRTTIRPPNGVSNAQRKWMDYQFGARFTLGVNSFYNVESSNGSLDPSIITLENLNVEDWVNSAIDAGMRYCIFTAKNHDGFCNWDTQHSFYNIMNTPFSQDLLNILADECSKNGLKLGLYYSLLDYYTSYYSDDQRYAELIFLQVNELLSNYGEIVELWFDGFWEKQVSGWDQSPIDFILAWRNEGAFRLKMDYLYKNIKIWQPECIVLNHATNDFVGLPLHPVDARSGVNISYVVVDEKFWEWQGRESYFPLEITMNLSGKDSGKFNPGNWYWHEDDETYPEKERIYRWLELAGRHDANLVLNCAISPEGNMRNVDKQLLESLWH